ncbi:MAG TPA: aldo/keto reductase [Xanthomonadales bacterium]|nr:aldo/keto reductase [Xanthomonadales bacterium]
MQYRRLGRTGLNVSILSLGSGGENRFGQARHVPRKDIHRLVRSALELGINFFDTSAAYEQSESLLGEALRGVPKNSYYLATKIFPRHGNRVLGGAETRRLVDRSLRRLNVDELDILQLHGVTPDTYLETRDRLMPELERLQAEGKVRYIGITESSKRDPQHRMLRSALQDNLFDTIMVAYDLSNRSAEKVVFPLAQANDVGVIAMAVARYNVPRSAATRVKLFAWSLASLAASLPDWGGFKVRLQGVLSALTRSGPRQGLDLARTSGGTPLQLPEAAYTFAASQPAVATVLTGTTSLVHLQRNVVAVLESALTAEEIGALLALLNHRKLTRPD